MANRRRSRLPGYSSQLLTCLPPIGVACCPEKKERGQKKARGSSSFPYLCAAGTSRECPQSKYDTHQTTATHAASTGVDRRVSTQAPPGSASSVPGKASWPEYWASGCGDMSWIRSGIRRQDQLASVRMARSLRSVHPPAEDHVYP